MKRTVVIVDDARTTRTHLRLMLEAHYDCKTAETAEEGIALVRSLPFLPDVVLMDVQMPGMGGVEGLRTLKSDPATKSVPVVMVTTRGEEVMLEKCREIGCDAYVTKPVQTATLFETLRGLWQRGAS